MTGTIRRHVGKTALDVKAYGRRGALRRNCPFGQVPPLALGGFGEGLGLGEALVVNLCGEIQSRQHSCEFGARFATPKQFAPG